MSNQAIIVLGMHRSGTSAVSGVLATLGAKAPKHLLPNAKDNPRGFWESAEVVRFHEQLLREAGSRWSDWDKFNPGWIDSASAEKFLDMVPRLIEQEFGDATLLLLKDPRMCRFVPFWLKALGRMGVVPKVVIPVRHPAEVAASLAARNKFGRNRALLLWLRHMLDAEADTRNVCRIFVRYTDFLTNWRGQAKRIGAELDIKWPCWSSSVELEIDRFLTSGLRHQMASSVEVCSSQGLQEWIERSYCMFELLADGAAVNAEVVLDEVRKELDRQSSIFATVVYEHAVLASEEIQEKEKERANLERQVAALENDIDQNGQERAVQEQRIASLDKESEQARSEKERLQASLTQCRGDLFAAAKDAERSRVMRLNAEQSLKLRINELSCLTRILMQKDDELESLAKDNGRLAAKVGKLEEKASAQSMEAEKRRQEAIAVMARCKGEIAALQRELDLVRNSIIWRMGLLMMVLVRRIRRFLGREPMSDAELVRQSTWFDASWYLAHYLDVAESGIDPVLHYITFGASEGRDPGPRFNTKRYLEQNADVAMSGTNALVHYLKQGKQEGRKPC